MIVSGHIWERIEPHIHIIGLVALLIFALVASAHAATPWYNTSYQFRVPLNITDLSSYLRYKEPKAVYMTFASGEVVNCSNETLVVAMYTVPRAIPVLVSNTSYAGGYCVGATLTFGVNMTSTGAEGNFTNSTGGGSNYYVYYGANYLGAPTWGNQVYDWFNDSQTTDLFVADNAIVGGNLTNLINNARSLAVFTASGVPQTIASAWGLAYNFTNAASQGAGAAILTSQCVGNINVSVETYVYGIRANTSAQDTYYFTMGATTPAYTLARYGAAAGRPVWTVYQAAGNCNVSTGLTLPVGNVWTLVSGTYDRTGGKCWAYVNATNTSVNFGANIRAAAGNWAVGSQKSATAGTGADALESIWRHSCYYRTPYDNATTAAPLSNMWLPFTTALNVSAGAEEWNGINFYATPFACPANTTRFAYFSFKDEDNEGATLVNLTIADTNGSYAISSSAGYLSLCKYNNNTNFSDNFTLLYWNNTAGYRNYYLAATNTTNTTITAYTNNISTASAVMFHTTDQFGVGQQNKIQHYLRYFPTTATWKLVDMGYTDVNGKYVSSIFTNGTTFYKIYSYTGFTGVLDATWNSESVYCIIGQSCEYDLYYPSSFVEPTYWDEYGLVSWNCSTTLDGSSYVNRTACSWTDGTGSAHNFTISTNKVNATGVWNVCNATNNTASGTVYCVINESKAGKIFTMTFVRNSNASVLEQMTYDNRAAAFLTIGALFAFIIIVSVGFLGLTIPSVAPLMVVVGLAVAVWGGFLQLHIGAIAALFFAALIIMWKQGGN